MATTVPTSAATTAANKDKQSKDRRRQYRSCDRCRSGKRACDASYTSVAEALENRVACSNCRKKGRTCSFSYVLSILGMPGGLPAPAMAAAASNSNSNSSDNDDAASLEADELEAASAVPAPDTDRAYPGAVAIKPVRSLTGWDAGWDRVQHDVLQCLQGVSFQSTSSRLTSNLDRIYLNDGLIRVYEGAAEQALRCWVTSSNTPYTLDRLSQSSGKDQGANNQLVYWRICELDRGSRALLGRDSPSEDREIMEAFHSVILAFAAQWAPNWIQTMAAQTGQGPHEGGAGLRATENRVRLALWERAREKLQAVSGLDSFRVIFSLIIFAWTEKPREVQERATGRVDIDIADESCALDTSSWQSPAEGSTLLLVAALRKLLTIRFKVESRRRRGLLPWTPLTAKSGRNAAPGVEASGEGSDIQRGLEEKKENGAAQASATPSSSAGAAPAARQISDVKRMEETYHMVFWLSIVIDTETAVLRKHPPVVSDEDSEVLRSIPYGGSDDFGQGSSASDGGVKGIWDDYIIDYSKKRTDELACSWPCDEAKASATLSFSTPVKVVLFRQISRLQMSFWRRASSENVEQHIASGLNIVRHWNAVYAPLLDSCRRHHGALPPSIQSWYVLIACPWYLAVLLFVEMVQTIDMAGASDGRRRTERARSGTFPRLRAQACSDMAAMIEAIQATDFSHGGTFDFVRDSGGTVLHTEPWTEILVHSVSAVAKTEIRLHDGLCAQFRWNELQDSRHRVQKCLWALEQLSDRSPSASLAFEQLSALAHARTKQQFHIEQIPMARPVMPDHAMAAAATGGPIGSSLADGGDDSLTPSSLAQVLEGFQGQGFAPTSEDDRFSTDLATLDDSAGSAGDFLELFMSKQHQHPHQHHHHHQPDSPGRRQSGVGAGACDVEASSDVSRSTLDSTAAAASHLFNSSDRHHDNTGWRAADASTTTTATSAPYSSSASSGKRRAEPSAWIDEELAPEERPRKVPRRHLSPTLDVRADRQCRSKDECETFFSPPLQDRPEYRDEAQMDEEEFYVDGRAAEMLEHHHRRSRQRQQQAASTTSSSSSSYHGRKRQSRKAAGVVDGSLATDGIEAAAPTTGGAGAGGGGGHDAGAHAWLDVPAATAVVSDCDVDWSSIFAMPM
ncbi:related to regulatory protein alcR [Pseudozyma flocculosa]|uniref:Related to regulatory protein alcR n=1 Tax=Pseudozyma flocculosa TaxID=84751 RepID=A0A5C3EZ39_9BASI|nr:related to regulatory protein alcR [Pseudozyma flocculosa]